jgi:hypothetical protein
MEVTEMKLILPLVSVLIAATTAMAQAPGGPSPSPQLLEAKSRYLKALPDFA